MAACAPLTRESAAEVYRRPLLELVFQAARVHREHHDPSEIQCSSLISIKTGACQEDCAYCPQASRYHTGVEREALLDVETVAAAARSARALGADRFCMGAAWREVKTGADFDRVLEMVREVKALGMETCATLGMLTPEQARRLSDAGLDFYNHNLDTSREFYPMITTTHGFDDRLRTLAAVRDAGLKVCCGGILGMGESEDDRIGLLFELARQDPQPESVPINALVAVEGTPLQAQAPLPWEGMLRTVAAARVLMPYSKVRLSAGRKALSEEAQALCFLAGANSIFLGDHLLTTANPGPDADAALFAKLGLRAARAAPETAAVLAEA